MYSEKKQKHLNFSSLSCPWEKGHNEIPYTKIVYKYNKYKVPFFHELKYRNLVNEEIHEVLRNGMYILFLFFFFTECKGVLPIQ